MEIAPDTYLKLFELLVKAISAKAYPYAEKKPTLKEIVNATELSGKKIKNISEHYLLASFSYFVNLRTKAWKDSKVNVHDIRLVKAFEFINKLPETEKYEGVEWGEIANQLVTQFENNHSLSKANKSNIEDPETSFLNVVASKENIFQSSTIQSIAYKYFIAICEQRLLDAWELLTPDLRKNSIWDGEFLNFEITSSFFESIESASFENFIYEFQKVSFEMFVEVNCSVFDVNEVIKVNQINFAFSAEATPKFRLMRKIISEGQNFNQDRVKMKRHEMNLSLSPYIMNQHIYKMNHEDCERLTVQQHYLVKVIDSQRNLTTDERRMVFNFVSRRRLTRHNRKFGLRINFTCKYIYNKWLIDIIRIIGEFPRSIK